MKWLLLLSFFLVVPYANAETYLQSFTLPSGGEIYSKINKESLQFLYERGEAPDTVIQDFGNILSPVLVSALFWMPTKVEADELTITETYRLYADAMANEYGVNKKRFIATLECESGFQNIQSRIPKKGGPNGREDSWGIAQINLPSHKDITRKQALTPFWAIRWAADKFQESPNIWTCYK